MPSKQTLIFLLLYGLTIFLTFNRHSKSTFDNYHSVIWGDKAGYYILLPSIFINSSEITEFQDDILKKTGNGFTIENGVIKTKYFIGVALLEMPFFLLALLVATILKLDLAHGFAPIFHWSIMISSVTYVAFGVLALKNTLLRYYSVNSVNFSLLTLFFGTNIYFFTVDQAGMSHCYSFFLFSTAIYLMDNIYRSDKKSNFYLLILVATLIILIRPINLIFLCFLPFLSNSNNWFLKLKGVVNLKFAMVCLGIIAITISPQLIYWKYESGSFIHYAYGSEGFDNYLSPKILETLFSPNNGLFPNTPFVLILVICMLMAFFNEKSKMWLAQLLLFFTITYVFSSWWNWHFGCSFGHRAYIEYFSVFIIPFVHFIDNKSFLKSPLFYFGLLAILFNLKMSYTVDNCWYHGDWDYETFIKLIFSAPN